MLLISKIWRGCSSNLQRITKWNSSSTSFRSQTWHSLLLGGIFGVTYLPVSIISLWALIRNLQKADLADLFKKINIIFLFKISFVCTVSSKFRAIISYTRIPFITIYMLQLCQNNICYCWFTKNIRFVPYITLVNQVTDTLEYHWTMWNSYYPGVFYSQLVQEWAKI